MQKKISQIYKTLIWNESVSLAVLDTTALINEAIRRHSLTPVAAAALGRTLTASAYLCSWLKNKAGSLSVTVDGGGAGGKIFVSGDGSLNIRGFIADPAVQLPPRADGKLDVGACVGKNGTLRVVQDDGRGIPFVGTSELVSGEIAEDFSAYFLTSEQRPTAIALGVKIGPDGTCVGAGGVFLQPLPNAGEECLRRVEEKISQYASLSSVIERWGAEEILREFGATLWDAREVRFRCHCSAKKTGGLVLALGRDEAERILAEEGEISVHCDFCNTDYKFNDEQVVKLFYKAEKERA